MIVCAVGTHKQQTPCKGDSGGATFAGFNRAYYAVGLTTLSHTTPCQPSKSIAYTRVSAYINWIKQYVEELPKPYKYFVQVEELEIDTEPFEVPEPPKNKDSP
ncbi:elastase-1-like [Argiope bruennichi]|nr:elastase-1-like [Argiope bruennichi]